MTVWILINRTVFQVRLTAVAAGAYDGASTQDEGSGLTSSKWYDWSIHKHELNTVCQVHRQHT